MSGIRTNVLEPVIISASRSTDIPAFYSDWMMERLREGYCRWINPFNRADFKVSFAKTRLIVFWTKNPGPIYERLGEMEHLGFRNYYFQVTLNDYAKEGLEPRVPPVESRIETFKKLSSAIGRGRVIWRFDPLILTRGLGVDELLLRVANIGAELKNFTDKLVFSFADISAYRKVVRNLSGSGCREFSDTEKIYFAKGLREINRGLGLELATCAEDVDLSAYGIKHNKCVDDDLMIREFSSDPELMAFIGAEYDMFAGWSIKKSRKDKGQRKSCGCVISKDIGMYGTCPHLCKYCYANTTDTSVLANYDRCRAERHGEFLIPV